MARAAGTRFTLQLLFVMAALVILSILLPGISNYSDDTLYRQNLDPSSNLLDFCDCPAAPDAEYREGRIPSSILYNSRELEGLNAVCRATGFFAYLLLLIDDNDAVSNAMTNSDLSVQRLNDAYNCGVLGIKLLNAEAHSIQPLIDMIERRQITRQLPIQTAKAIFRDWIYFQVAASMREYSLVFAEFDQIHKIVTVLHAGYRAFFAMAGQHVTGPPASPPSRLLSFGKELSIRLQGDPHLMLLKEHAQRCFVRVNDVNVWSSERSQYHNGCPLSMALNISIVDDSLPPHDRADGVSLFLEY